MSGAGAANDGGGGGEPARKRIRLESGAGGVLSTTTPTITNGNTAENRELAEMVRAKIAEVTTKASHSREREVGILKWVNEKNTGFEGVLKQRYTDFLVNEITPDGKVVHLTSLSPPKRHQEPKPAPAPQEVAKPVQPVEAVPETTATEVTDAATVVEGEAAKPVAESIDASATPEAKDEFSLTTEDEVLLDKYFGADVRGQVVKLYKKILAKPNEKAAAYGSVTSEPILDRELRTKLHQDMRRIFSSKLETNTDKDGLIRISAAPRNKPPGPRGAVYQQERVPRNQQKGKLGWAELGGEYLHFSLFKENRDTMEIISFIAGKLGMKPRAFSFAGTKDRRGVTVQRVSVFRKYAEQIAALNRDMRGSRVGDFTYEKHDLELGDLTGNEFLITLRDCQFPGAENLDDAARLDLANKVVADAVKSIQAHGFLNYYGLQRFGTYLIGTDEIGKLILKSDFKGAVDAILSYNEECLSAGSDPDFITSDGKPLSRDDIARAQAIHIFQSTGRSRDALNKLPRKFSAESTIIRHLERADRKTDFMGAILQINRGLRLMYVHAYQSLVWNHAVSERWARVGDRVVAGDLVIVDKDAAKPAVEEFDQNGEVVVLPAADDTAVRGEDMFERARPLSAEEAASGAFSIFDIVLPTPGYDVEYPANEIGDFYREFMGSERGGGLDPANMRRAQKDFSLSGSYRKVMGRVGDDVTYEVRAYTADNEQMVETDLDRINKARGPRPQGRNVQSQDQAKPAESARRYQGAHVFNAAGSANSAGKDAWANATAAIKEADRKQDAAATAALEERAAVPSFKETFIQTNAEDGSKTGVRETAVLPGTGVSVRDVEMADVAAAAAVAEAAAAGPGVGEKRGVGEGVEEEEKRMKIAVVVKFQLGSSQYATMALRELMKEGGVVTYKTDFSSGR